MQLPLHAVNGHLFVELDDRQFLVDTGATSSFGAGDSVTLSGITFPFSSSLRTTLTFRYFTKDSARVGYRSARSTSSRARRRRS